MFVESMSFEEIRQEFERDKTALINKIVAHGFSLQKMMRKTNITFFNKYYDYVSPRKNRWVHHFISHPEKKGKLKVDLYAYFSTRRSYAVIYYSLDADRLTYCTSHFFTRYYERKELERDAAHMIIRQFMTENYLQATHLQKEVEPDILQCFTQMKNGVGLGYMHRRFNLVELRTFITNEMLKADQRELSKQLEDKFHLHVVRKSPEDI